MTANPDFKVQNANNDYWRVVCRHCAWTWYLPKDESKRTTEAPAIWREHAAKHAANKTQIAKLPFMDAKGDPTNDPEQSYWSRRACQRLGTEDALAVVSPTDREQAARFVEAVMARFGAGPIIVRKSRNYSELRREHRDKGDVSTPASWHSQTVKGKSTMAIGKRKTEFMPSLKYNASTGTFHTMDRVQRNGEWVTEAHDVTDEFTAVFDLENIETGWILFPEKGGPETVLAPPGKNVGPAPSKKHRQGVRVIVKVEGDDAGAREILSTAAAFWNGVDALHDAYLAEAANHPGQLPVVTLANVQAVETSNGVSCTPIFEIVDWVDRPADMPKLLQPRPQPTRKESVDDMDDAIPF
jgi:hypothetical protein